MAESQEFFATSAAHADVVLSGTVNVRKLSSFDHNLVTKILSIETETRFDTSTHRDEVILELKGVADKARNLDVLRRSWRDVRPISRDLGSATTRPTSSNTPQQEGEGVSTDAISEFHP